MLTQSFTYIESARAHTLTRPTRYSKWALLRSRLQTAALKRKKKSSRDHPCWFPFEEHGRIVGITEETLICPPLTLSLIHTHSQTPTHRLLFFLPLQWVIGDVSVPDQYWVSLPQIAWQAKKPSGMDGKGKAKKTYPICSANINLDWVLGECVSKKGWKFK